jgi:dephospho-CoA kinase
MTQRTPTPDRVPFIGLTGGIGAGKSTALEQLRGLDCVTLSADEAVHQIQQREEVRDALVERFGGAVAPGGVVDRGELAKAAFADADSRRWLEQLIWPLVGQAITDFREAADAAAVWPRAAVVEVPLLFESGMDAAFDHTVCVVTDESVRSQRAAERGHEAVDERTARQLTQQEKAERASVVAVNDGSVDDLKAELSSALVKIGV